MGRWPLSFLAFHEQETEIFIYKEKGRVRDGHIHSSYASLSDGASLLGRGDGHLHSSFSDLGDGEMATSILNILPYMDWEMSTSIFFIPL